MAGNEFRILFFVSKTSDLGAALFSNCFCWGRVLPEKKLPRGVHVPLELG